MAFEHQTPKTQRTVKPSALPLFLYVVCAWICTSSARAEIQHTVRPGQSLAAIAKRYNRSVAELAAANGLGEDVQLHGGQVLTVPPEGVVYVTAGQTLSQIAHAHHLGFLELAKVNHISPDTTLRIGQRLVLPGFSASKRETAAEKRWGRPAKRGVVTMYRIMSGERQSLALVDSRGRVNVTSQKQLREFLRPRESRKRKTPNSRLLALLAQVSDHFGGRQIHVVSGYRLAGGLTKDTSQHVAGNAIDFRIPGVPLEELRDYCHHFDNVGVGFYPRTQFVHLDVRKKPARWTDWSLAGQPAILTKPTELDEPASEVAEAAHRHDSDIPEPEEALQPSDAAEATHAAQPVQPPAALAPSARAIPATAAGSTLRLHYNGAR